MASKQVLELIAAAHRDRAKKLDLSGQKLNELPDSIGDLTHLTHLYLKGNSIKSLPDSI
jgi:Leucine-rich repeat (LRR) protein